MVVSLWNYFAERKRGTFFREGSWKAKPTRLPASPPGFNGEADHGILAELLLGN
jgi:hypothetical protein